MLEWITQRFPDIELPMNKELIYSWTDIQRVLTLNKSLIIPQLYKTISWQVNSLKFYQDQNNLENRDLIRIMASKDHDIYYKVCSILSMEGIPSGDKDSNSHQYAIMQLIQELKTVGELENKDSIKPILLATSTSSDELTPYALESPNRTSEYDAVEHCFKGQDLALYNSDLADIVDQSLSGNGYVTVNNVRRDSSEFKNYTILPGDNIVTSVNE
jgi:hypothetical protein